MHTDKLPQGQQNHKPLERNEKWAQLVNAITLRSSQNQVLWTIFGIFSAANGILLVALFAGGDFPKAVVGAVVCAAGAFLSLTWFLIQRRGLGYVRMYEELMREIEENLRFDPDYGVSEVNRNASTRCLPRWPRARSVMPVCCVVWLLFWVAFLIFFMYRLRESG